MAITPAYTIRAQGGSMLLPAARFLIPVLFISTVLNIFEIQAQESPPYDEIAVYVEVERIGGTEMVVIIKGETVFLPITDLFDFLRIRNIAEPDMTSISGFFINPDAKYFISRTDNLITYEGRTTGIEPGGLIRTEANLYLKASYFGRIFGLDCNFNFRTLSVKVTSRTELPMIREMRLEEMRRNLSMLKGDVQADTSISRIYPMFRTGVADWSVITSEEIKGRSDARVNLSLGAMIAGGEATAALYYNSLEPLTHRQQYYQWRFVNNDFAPVRQIMAGKIATQASASIFNPVVGVQLTNSPSTYRQSFGSYLLSDKTEPGWIVELYVNNVLVDYVQADASGFYTFEVPLVYGNSVIQTKFYGPWGEERTKEQTVSIPFNFLPKNVFEYKVSAGLVEDSLLSRFSRASFNYGIGSRLTAGAGMEYLSSVVTGPAMPFLTASWNLAGNLLLSGEYIHGVRTRGTLSYRIPSNLQMEINYAHYEPGQTAINLNYLEELKAVVTIPVKIGSFSTFQRLSMHHLVLPGSGYFTGEWLFSGSYGGIGTNLTTYAILPEKARPNIYSNLSLNLSLPKGFIMMSQAQYGYTQNTFFSAKLAMYKYLFRQGFLNVSLEHNFLNKVSLAELGFRYDFSFAQAGSSVRQSAGRTSFIQYARGSLIYDRRAGYAGSDNRMNVGRGGIAVIPFLDLNANGIRDAGEPKVPSLNLRAGGGRVQRNGRDSSLVVLGLEPYTQCFIDLDPNSFDEITWRLPFNTLAVAVEPNIIKTVEIPVTVAGEASGTAVVDYDGVRKGQARILVGIYDTFNRLVGRALTEEDGYFSYFGLVPGAYHARVDSSQMSKLGMSARPGSIEFRIGHGRVGDIARDLDFSLYKIIADTIVEVVTEPVAIPKTVRDTAVMIIHEMVEELITISHDSWAIQLGAFKVRGNAENLSKSLEKLLGRKVMIVTEGDFFKVRIIEIASREEADELIEILRRNGVTELWLITLKAMQQQKVLTERIDTVRTVTETVIGKVTPSPVRVNSIQAGAFYIESNAVALKERLEKQIDKKVVIVEEGGFFKVRIEGFTGRTEMEKYLSVLRPLGLRDLWILPEIPVQDSVRILPVVTDTIPPPVDEKKIIERRKEADIAVDTVIIIPREVPEPTLALQAGVYPRYLQALRAQRKIRRKLGLPVEILHQWDLYRVLVTGFYTREEAFRYYPELAGLGFQQISVVEKRDLYRVR